MSKVVNNFAGLNGFVWWVGAIEDRADPLGLGRCRVRIFGWYGPEISTTDLPWASAMYPINNSKSFMCPELNDWVMGFFMDGESGQFPIMMGVLPGFASASSSDTALNVSTSAAGNYGTVNNSLGPNLGGMQPIA